jgi:hypothetical protein
MKPLLESLHIIATRKDSRRIIIVATIAFILLLLTVQNGKDSFEVFGLTSLPLLRRITLFCTSFFDLKSTFTSGTLILATLGALLGGINISLAYTYIKLRGEAIVKSGLYSGIGLFLAFLGVGCAACGTAFLSVIVGFFGFSAMIEALPYQGAEIGYIGLIFICIATYSLSKKITAPNVC